MKHLIIGNSAAGLFAAEEIRRRDQDAKITLLTSEFYPSYSRCLTTYYIAGDITQNQIYLRAPENHRKLNFQIQFMTEVTELNPAWKKVLSRDGREWSYDRLLIATGALPVRLGVPGEELPQVFTLRTMDDALEIEKQMEWGKRVVVVGGGLVSFKSAYALFKRGLKVTVVVSSKQILSQMLDAQSAQLIQNHLEEHGMKILLGASVKRILGREAVQGVELTDGRILWANLVIIGKGVKPNVKPFLSSGIRIKRGIVTNSYLETNIPDVYAAGDCAETWDRVRDEYRVNATWPNATMQGRIAGANMVEAKVKYPGSVSMNAVDFFGLSAISAGIIVPPSSLGDGKAETVIPADDIAQDEFQQNAWTVEESLKYLPSGTPVYERLVRRGKILKGYVLIGDTSRAGILTRRVEEGKEVPEGRKSRKIFAL